MGVHACVFGTGCKIFTGLFRPLCVAGLVL